MIALSPLPNSETPRAPGSQGHLGERFLLLLPIILRVAKYAFRCLPREQRDDAIAEVVANAFVAFVRLVGQGKEDVAFATPLARYAVAAYNAGRRVGNRLNQHDVGSACCQRLHGLELQSLCRQTADGRWEDVVIQDRRSTPADIAIVKIDFRAWLRRLTAPKRAAAKLLAAGAATAEVAARLSLSSARISQLRRELEQDWNEFQQESTGFSLLENRSS